jgi:hypothetical protein
MFTISIAYRNTGAIKKAHLPLIFYLLLSQGESRETTRHEPSKDTDKEEDYDNKNYVCSIV